jgi:hypothetical protein
MSVTGLGQSLVIQGLPNRTALPPASPGFVSMQLTRAKRLRTNQVTWDQIGLNPTTLEIEQGTELRLQLDLYGAGSGDWGVMLETLLRDETACVALAPTCQPLYSSDATLVPLDDDEQQYEQRWMIEAVLQYNPVTTTPMQFANTLEVTLINVDETYPP